MTISPPANPARSRDRTISTQGLGVPRRRAPGVHHPGRHPRRARARRPARAHRRASCAAPRRTRSARARLRLLGHGKGHNILDDPARDRLLVGIMSGLAGHTGGVIAVTRSAPCASSEDRAAAGRRACSSIPRPTCWATSVTRAACSSACAPPISRASPGDPEVPANLHGPRHRPFRRAHPPWPRLRRERPAAHARRPGLARRRLPRRSLRAPVPRPSSRYPSSWLALSWGCDWDPSPRVSSWRRPLGQLVTVLVRHGRRPRSRLHRVRLSPRRPRPPARPPLPRQLPARRRHRSRAGHRPDTLEVVRGALRARSTDHA